MKDNAQNKSAACSLPCLNTNNSTERVEKQSRKLSSAHRKTAFALRENVGLLVVRYGLSNVGFMTLTFSKNISDMREAQRRFNSLASHVLTNRYLAWICVVQRHMTGRVHFHLIVAIGRDIRAGINFAEVKCKNYSSANVALRGEWTFWRGMARRYGFGRVELLPIKSTAQAVAKYVSEYIEKHIGNRETADKGARLVRYSRGTNHFSSRFSWNTPNAKLWRRKLQLFAERFGFTSENYSEGFRQQFGDRWLFHLNPLVQSIELSQELRGNTLEAAFRAALTMQER
jgi:hypothetical protein